MLAAPAERNQVRTRCQRMTTPGPTRRKKREKSAPRGRLSLDNGGPHKGSARLLAQRLDVSVACLAPPSQTPWASAHPSLRTPVPRAYALSSSSRRPGDPLASGRGNSSPRDSWLLGRTGDRHPGEMAEQQSPHPAMGHHRNGARPRRRGRQMCHGASNTGLGVDGALPSTYALVGPGKEGVDRARQTRSLADTPWRRDRFPLTLRPGEKAARVLRRAWPRHRWLSVRYCKRSPQRVVEPVLAEEALHPTLPRAGEGPLRDRDCRLDPDTRMRDEIDMT